MTADDYSLRNSDAGYVDRDVHASREDLSSQCLLYLAGELSSEETQTLEQQLLVSAEAMEELVRQSRQLCLLTGCSIPASSVGVTKHFDIANDEQRSSSLLRFVALVAAIAASVLLVLSLRTSERSDSLDIDDAMFAAAWAATDTAWSDPSSIRDESELVVPETLVATDSIDFVGPFGDEAIPSWMLAAMDSSSELLDAAADDIQRLDAKFESERL